MFNKYEVYVDGKTEPILYQSLTVDVSSYNDLAGDKANVAGLRLFCAFVAVEGREPATVRELKTWGRTRQAIVIDGPVADPTPPETSGDS